MEPQEPSLEQPQHLERLVVQTEADIQTFSLFLRALTAAILMLYLVFAYNCVTGGATLPFTNYGLRAEHPVAAAELGVLTLQLTLHLLSSGSWDRITRGAVAVLAVCGVAHAATCAKHGMLELYWWLLPVLDLGVVSYAQLNMRRSRASVERLVEKAHREKDE